MIAAVLLAAGASRRMGSPKQLLRYRGQSLLRQAALSALVAGCRPLIVVLGYEAGRMKEELAGLDATAVVNEGWERGIGTSVRAGIAAVPAEAEAALIALADQPMVGATVLATLVSRYERNRPEAVGCEYGGTLGVPALFARRLFPALLALGDEEGAKRVLGEAAAARVPFPEAGVDIDTPEDYRNLGRGEPGA
ncbi:MAG: nucleotidyltransferase family protein [Gemmataceae bacterium]